MSRENLEPLQGAQGPKGPGGELFAMNECVLFVAVENDNSTAASIPWIGEAHAALVDHGPTARATSADEAV